MRYPPDNDDLGAIALLNSKINELCAVRKPQRFEEYAAAKLLYHALCHLAKPDRDIYPKRRPGARLRAV